MVNIMGPEGKLLLEPNPDFTRGIEPSAQLKATILEFNGVFRFAARKMIAARLEADGLMEKIELHTHVVPHGDRSNAVIEPRLTDQWYVDAKTLAAPAIDVVKRGRTVFVPKNWETTYFHWMENIQPWCISRQLWWGHQIPAWYGPNKRDPGDRRRRIAGARASISHPEERFDGASRKKEAVSKKRSSTISGCKCR